MIKKLENNIKLVNTNTNTIEKHLKDYVVTKTRIMTICFKFAVGDELYIPLPLIKGLLDTALSDKFSDLNKMDLKNYIMQKESYNQDFLNVNIIECIGNYGYGTEVSYQCKVKYNNEYLKYINGQDIEILVPESYLISSSELDAYIDMDRKCYVSEGYNSILKSRYGVISPLSEESKCLKLISKISTWSDFIMEEIEVPDEIEGEFADGTKVKGNIDAIVTVKGQGFVEALMRVKYYEESETEVLADYKIIY